MSPKGIVSALLLLTSLLGCAHGERPLDNQPTPCVPSFPYANGWLGGDAAYSVNLPTEPDAERGATLWLFGDSFVAEQALPNRVGASFIHNSIGLSRCTHRGFEITYYWRHDEAGEPRAFFDSGNATPYWWPLDGFVHAGALYVGLLEVNTAPPEDTLQLPFRLSGVKLMRISNPLAAPDEWNVEVSTLSRSRRAFPASSMLVAGEYAYFFSFSELRNGRQPRFLSRLALEALELFPDDLSPHLETLLESELWAAGFQPDRAQILMNDNASEMSVEHHPDLGRWLAVYGSPVQTSDTDDGSETSPTASVNPSDDVYLRVAERLEGPWSDRIPLFRIPELQPEHPASRDPNTICYAAKEHGAFSRPGELLITYVCNLRTHQGQDPWAILERLARRMDLYRPRPVLLPLPDGVGAR